MKIVLALLAMVVLATMQPTMAYLSAQEVAGISALISAMPGLTQDDYDWEPQHPEYACSFEGVTCHIANDLLPKGQPKTFPPSLQLVTSISIRSFVGGSLPADISAFKNLSGLTLQNAGITGPLPASLATLENLYSLTIDGSSVTGSLPDVSEMKNIHFITIANTLVSGTLPSNWASLPKIQYVELNNNKLVGTIPSSWTQWRNIQRLNLAGNSFSGPVPGFTANVNLRYLNLAENAFSGALPATIGPTLMEIDLSQNQLTGTIPEWNMQWRLPSPKNGQLTWFVLNLKNNSLVGTIPDIFDSAPYWNLIDLSHNKLTGPIPASLTQSELNVWTGIILNHNQLNLCPAPKSFDVTWGNPSLGAPGICQLNNQQEKPPCQCVVVYAGTNCAPVECI